MLRDGTCYNKITLELLPNLVTGCLLAITAYYDEYFDDLLSFVQVLWTMSIMLLTVVVGGGGGWVKKVVPQSFTEQLFVSSSVAPKLPFYGLAGALSLSLYCHFTPRALSLSLSLNFIEPYPPFEPCP